MIVVGHSVTTVFSVLLTQSDGDSAVTPSSRAQKIARAKWEFLFGGSAGESRSRRGGRTEHNQQRRSVNEPLQELRLIHLVSD